MVTHKNISALILAAGYSSRMGHFKPLSALGPSTPVERCVNLFKSAGIDDIRVVVGHRHAEITEFLHGIGIRPVLNKQFQEGMFSSVKSGLSSFDKTPEAFFILPVDIPLVRTSSVYELLETLSIYSPDVIYPCFLGKRGHPPLIKGELIPEILQFEGDGGLRGYLKDKTALNVELPDENILRDMDFPDQYLNMLDKLQHHDVPSKEECLAFLLHRVKAHEMSIRKAKRTEEIAEKLYLIKRENNPLLSPRLISAMALLFEPFAVSEHRYESIADLSEKFGESQLTQFLEGTTNKTDFGGRLAGETEIVELAHLIATENDPAMIIAAVGSRLAEAELLALVDGIGSN